MGARKVNQLAALLRLVVNTDVVFQLAPFGNPVIDGGYLFRLLTPYAAKVRPFIAQPF